MSEYEEDDAFAVPENIPSPTLESLEMELRSMMAVAARIVRDSLAGGDACQTCGRPPQPADRVSALKGLQRLESLVLDIGKMRGIIRTNVTVTHNLADSPEWATVRTAIYRALERHPEALADVRRALQDQAPSAANPSPATRRDQRVMLLQPARSA